MPAISCMQSVLRRQLGNYLQLALCAVLLAACGSVPQAPVEPDAKAGGNARRPASASASSRPALPAAGSGRGGYYLDDGPGDQVPDNLLATPDAEPRIEPYANRGNRPYVVFGKTYTPFLDDRPFRQRGRASWYGKKFHGQRTSSGEPYDMYTMSAAHPTLPIPSYARVTNVANGKQVIVRVNDRGPFHSERIMDLSYTAALKLGYLQHGSAELELERLLPEEIMRMSASRQAPTAALPEQSVVADAPAAGRDKIPVTAQAVQPQVKPAVSVFAVPVASAANATNAASDAGAAGAPVLGGFYLQLGAYAQAGGAEVARSRLQQQWEGVLPPIEVIPAGAIFRLFSGPFASRAEAADVAQKLKDGGASRPLVVQR